MKRHLPTSMALGSAGAALLLGACGFGTAQAHHTTPNLTALYHRAAQCVREHGYPNFPDPTIDSNGKAQLPPGVQPPATVPPECQSLVDQASQASGEANGGSHQPTHDVAKLRLFAQCMRDHGLDNWPDPDTQGRFHLPADLQGKNGPRWPAIHAGWDACAQYDPGGSIDVVP